MPCRAKVTTPFVLHEQEMVQLFMSERYADESTALHHLEQAEWDLKAAMPMYMPPEPQSPMVGRTLATSNFKKACGCTIPASQS